MPKIYVESNRAKKIYLGNTQIKKIFLGNNLVFSGEDTIFILSADLKTAYAGGGTFWSGGDGGTSYNNRRSWTTTASFEVQGTSYNYLHISGQYTDWCDNSSLGHDCCIYLDKQNADGTWSVASSGTNVQGSIPSGYLTILEKHGTRSGTFSINKYIELPDKIDFIGRIRIESHSYTDQWPGIYGVYNYPNSTTTLKSGFTLITTNDTSN